MPSALSIIGAIALGLVGAGGMYEWDRHPPLGWHAHVLFWNPGFDLPDSLATQRDKAVTLAQVAVRATTQCQIAIGQQNKDIAAAAELDAATLAQTEASLHATQAQVAALRQSAAALKTYVPQGADICSRWTDADRMVKLMLEGK